MNRHDSLKAYHEAQKARAEAIKAREENEHNARNLAVGIGATVVTWGAVGLLAWLMFGDHE